MAMLSTREDVLNQARLAEPMPTTERGLKARLVQSVITKAHGTTL